MATPIKQRRRAMPNTLKVYPTFPQEVTRLRQERRRLIETIRQSEWQFEREPSTLKAVTLGALRVALSELELRLAAESEAAS